MMNYLIIGLLIILLISILLGNSNKNIVENLDNSCDICIKKCKDTNTCNNEIYSQCGGNDWKGETCCPAKSKCVAINEFYSQCLLSNDKKPPVPTPPKPTPPKPTPPKPTPPKPTPPKPMPTKPTPPKPTPPTPTPQKPTPPKDKGKWKSGLSVTHYYDCGGQSCDAPLLQPWDKTKFIAGPGYTVLDPNDFGGAKYGEKMWIYGAASDILAKEMGKNIPDLGYITEGDANFGCGQSILIRNSNAKNPNWTALVMRKSRCPPWSSGCDKPHMDLMIPGFDNLQYSTANRCGTEGTGMSKEQSAICGALDNPSTCDLCEKLPSDFTKGCKLFVEWGWKTGNPTCDYKVVETPNAFIEYTKKIQLS
jgi:hypothetical protein